MRFDCSWCDQTIEIDHGSGAYVYSVALLHFNSCRARPASITKDQIRKMAGQVADQMETQQKKELEP